MTLVSPKQVAAFLGVRIETVYRMAQEGRLPVACRIGPKLRFDQDEIEAWVKKGGTAQ
jgi:excisionase family DNA binding protein